MGLGGRAATLAPAGTGLIDPRTGKRPFAVVQLRQDDRELCYQ